MKRPAYPGYKPSGVEWLGDVPAHWTCPPLYTRYSIDLGKMLNEARITGDHLLPYLRNIDVQWDRICFDDLPEMDVTPGERMRFTVRRGDLLVCEGEKSDVPQSFLKLQPCLRFRRHFIACVREAWPRFRASCSTFSAGRLDGGSSLRGATPTRSHI